MKLKPCVLAKTILKAVKTFPAVVLTGHRQSGKTTSFQMLFKMINEPGLPIDTAATISGTEDDLTVKGDVINYGWKNVSGF
jgi:predicted AAA+ superfamily ATPase